MSEQVIRHRGGGRDENGQLIPAAEDTAMTPWVIAPGGGSQVAERGRNSETTAYTAYFAMGTDIVTSDELTVRGQRFPIVVNKWNVDGRGCVEVFCTRGQG